LYERFLSVKAYALNCKSDQIIKNLGKGRARVWECGSGIAQN
jgi:hypothetical protein